MTRFPARVGALCAVAALFLSTRPAAAQTIYTSNGFEPGTFNTGTITGEGFTPLPSAVSTAALVQTGTVFSGTQALRVNGPGTQENLDYGNVNFWYKPYTLATAVNPVALGTPHVQISGQFRMSATVTTAFADIPFAGFHLEGYTAGGDQQMVSPIYMATDGRFMVLTTEGLEMYSTQAFGREQWHSVVADFNFTTQMFRVYVNNELLNFSGSPDVPFRNTFDDTVSIAEIGFEATWNSVTDTGGLNQFFIDDYLVTRSNVAYAPVPEPASCLAVAGLALVGYRRLRKGRVTAAVPQP